MRQEYSSSGKVKRRGGLVLGLLACRVVEGIEHGGFLDGGGELAMLARAAVVALGHILKLKMVLEFVRTEAKRRLLSEIGSH
ncbi:hypothetical protein NX875_29100, partial [Burkholderia thailandensis]|nr:hypothetical protein [Burkholderia thailandensis]